MKAYDSPELVLMTADIGNDIMTASALPDYVDLGDITKIGTPTSNDFNGLSDGGPF